MVRIVLFDIEEASLEDFVSALSKTFHNCYEDYPNVERVLRRVGKRERVVEACGILYSLRRMGFELFTTPLPLPERLDVAEGSDLEFYPRRSRISAEVLAVLSEFCRTLRRPFRVERVHEFGGMRIVLGELFESDDVVIVETNLDDVSGEMVAHAMRKLEEICLDVFAVQCLGKKGRPAIVLKAICEQKDVHRVASVMMGETGSLGVRMIPVKRLKESRRIEEREVEVFGRRFKVRVKLSSASVFKPEFEDVRAIAEELGLPIVAVYKEILRKL